MNWGLREAIEAIRSKPRRWLVTGAAGFIGSHLVQFLLNAGQEVVGLDNFITGKQSNLDHATANNPIGQFSFVRGDILDLNLLGSLIAESEVVLHQAALGSVPRSIENPCATHASNVTGTLNVLEACRLNPGVRLVFASSSSVYGELKESPKVEERIGTAISPYALSKQCNEQYAQVFARCYGLKFAALRYFNVFGPRQDPQGEYAAVIPRWIASMQRGEQCMLYGDGSTSRDFCYIDNVVQANLLAATVPDAGALGRAYNIACGESTTLIQLYSGIREGVLSLGGKAIPEKPLFRDFRAGDIKHSLASIDAARVSLGYTVTKQVREGLLETVRYAMNAE